MDSENSSEHSFWEPSSGEYMSHNVVFLVPGYRYGVGHILSSGWTRCLLGGSGNFVSKAMALYKVSIRVL